MAKGKRQVKGMSRKAAGNKAARIRKKLREGKDVTSDDKAFLAAWNAEKNAGRPTKEAAETDASSTPSPAKTSASSKEKPDSEASRKPRAVATETGEDAAISSKGPETSAPPPPKAPKVLASRKGGGRAGDWRAKYTSDAMGREATCQQIGAAYCGVLKRLVRYIEAEGGTPVIDAAAIDSEIFPAAILTADAILPPDFDAGPQATVAVGSGFLIGQAAVTRWRKNKAEESAPAKAVGVSEDKKPEDTPKTKPAADVTPIRPRDEMSARANGENSTADASKPVL